MNWYFMINVFNFLKGSMYIDKFIYIYVNSKYFIK